MATLRLLALAVIAAQQAGRGGLGQRWVQEGGRGGRPLWTAGDPATDLATIADVVPGTPSEAWTELFPARLWETSVARRGHRTWLEPPRHRRRGNAADARKVTADGGSPEAWTQDRHDAAPRPWTPERIDSRQQRLAVRVVHRWRADGA
jgi:hypothetical protein